MKRIFAILCAVGMLLFPATGHAFAAKPLVYANSYQQQLLPQEAQLCQLMLANFNTQTPAFTYKLDPPFPVTSEASGEQVRRWVYRAYEAAYRDHPEIFWVTKSGGMNVSLAATATGSKQEIVSVTMKVIYTDLPTVPQKKAKLEATVAQILKAAPATPYEKIVYFHDVITSRCTYDEPAKTQPAAHPESYEAYGALCNQKAVCEGYAKAFKLLCDRSGISAVLVGGQGLGESHMWNYVQLDGKYYLLDATFDDPIGGTPTQAYLLKGSQTTAADHRPDSFFIENFDAKFIDPVLSPTDYQPNSSPAASTTALPVPAAEIPATQTATTPLPAKKKNCMLQYSGKTTGGNFTVAYAGVAGALDLKQQVLNGVCLEVRTYPKSGYKTAEIKADMGAGTVSMTNSGAFTFAVTDDCKVSVSFQPAS